MRRIAWAMVWVAAMASAADVVDRVAVVVGKEVLTQSEVEEALRVTEYINGEPLDLSAARRRAAAERLVDQQLLRNEMAAMHFAMPTASETNTVFEEFVRRRGAGDHAGLERYGVTQDQLREQLGWQLAVLRFTDVRFRSDVVAANDSAGASSADRQVPGAETVDQQMENWLKEARANTRIVFEPEAFR